MEGLGFRAVWETIMGMSNIGRVGVLISGRAKLSEPPHSTPPHPKTMSAVWAGGGVHYS